MKVGEGAAGRAAHALGFLIVAPALALALLLRLVVLAAALLLLLGLRRLLLLRFLR